MEQPGKTIGRKESPTAGGSGLCHSSFPPSDLPHASPLPLWCSTDALPGQSTTGKRPLASPNPSQAQRQGRRSRVRELPLAQADATGCHIHKPCPSSPTPSASRRPRICDRLVTSSAKNSLRETNDSTTTVLRVIYLLYS